MRYQQFKDWKISQIGIGCYGLSGAYGRVDLESYRRTLERAYELGINFFDTAQAYGEAEVFLGRVIKPFREKVYLATKVSGKEGLEPDLSERSVRAACQASLQKLGTDYIDLYQVHFDDTNTRVETTVAALERLVREGKIRRYGVCHLPATKIIEYVTIGNPFSIQMELSAAARAARDTLLPICREHQLAALAFSVTGRGGLTGKIDRQVHFDPGDIRSMDPLFQRGRFESLHSIAQKFAEMGESYHARAVQVAVAWVLAQEGVVCALTGPSKVEHLEENARASELRIQPQDLKSIETFLDAEDVTVQRKQTEEVFAILTTPLPTSPEQAFVDLVYVLDTAVLLGLVEEKAILPIFQEFIRLRKELSSIEVDTLSAIQARIKEMIC